MSEISPSSIRTTKSLEEKIAACQSQAEVTAVLREEALAQRVVQKEWDESILSPTPLVEKLMGTTVTVGGSRYELVGTNQEDLVRQETEIYRGLLQAHTAEASREQPRDSQGRFAERSEEDQRAIQAAQTAEASRVAGLELQLKIGQITTDQFIRESGLIEKHLAQREGDQMKSGWEAATQEFLKSEEGKNWRGGDDLFRMTEILSANGLEDAPDKLAALKEGWRLMQQEEYEAAVTKTATETNDPYELRNALQGDRHSGDLWGR